MTVLFSSDDLNTLHDHSLNGAFQGQWKQTMAIYKHGRGVEIGSTKKQLQLSGQSGMIWGSYSYLFIFTPWKATGNSKGVWGLNA